MLNKANTWGLILNTYYTLMKNISEKNYILICNTKYTYNYICILYIRIYDWISICADREIIMNATRVGGSTTPAGEMGGNLRGDNIKDNNETETNFNRSGVRKTLTIEERILLKSGINAYNYYNGDYLVVIINSRKMCSMMHRNLEKIFTSILNMTVIYHN